MEPNENQQEGGKRCKKEASKDTDACHNCKRLKNFISSDTRKIVNETCSQTVHLFI